MNWDLAIENGVSYAIIRSSNGLGSSTTDANGRDNQLYRNASELTRLGIPWAIYHFLQENQDIDKQVALVTDILADLKQRGTYPRSAILPTGLILPTVFNDVERFGLTPIHVKSFHDGLSVPTGVYTRKSVWDVVMAGAKNWWSKLPCWVAAYSKDDDGTLPPWKPWIPNGFTHIDIWQYTSKGGWLVDSAAGLDLNIASPFEGDVILPPIDPPDVTFDILDYMRGDNRLFEMQLFDANGNKTSQERNQTQRIDGGFYIVKGENQGYWERYWFDDNFIYQDTDTSPSNASDGTERYYQVRKIKGGSDLSGYAKRHMKIGETFNDGGHFVQFYRKNDCTSHAENSGAAANTTVLVDHFDKFDFSGLLIDDVIEVRSGSETHFFARGYGRVGWSSQWGSAEISEVHAAGQRPDIVREIISCM